MKPIIYLYFHSIIYEWKGKEMTEKEFRSCFFQWRIPKNLRYRLAQEMEELGLIKIEGRMVKLIGTKLTFERKKNNKFKEESREYKPYNKLQLISE